MFKWILLTNAISLSFFGLHCGVPAIDVALLWVTVSLVLLAVDMVKTVREFTAKVKE